MRIFSVLCLFLATAIGNSAFAYIGPGLGAGTVAVILGVIGSVFLALFAIFWYPIKRLLKKFRKPKQESEPEQEPAGKDVVERAVTEQQAENSKSEA
jgi:hypothetical protein